MQGVTLLHLCLLHKYGSNNPLGINTDITSVPFYPYFYVKDFFSFWIFLLGYLSIVFFGPNLLGHPDNYIPANPMVTPAHIYCAGMVLFIFLCNLTLNS